MDSQLAEKMECEMEIGVNIRRALAHPTRNRTLQRHVEANVGS